MSVWSLVHRASGKTIAKGSLGDMNDMHDYLCDNDLNDSFDFVRNATLDETYDQACITTACEYLEFFFGY